MSAGVRRPAELRSAAGRGAPESGEWTPANRYRGGHAVTRYRARSLVHGVASTRADRLVYRPRAELCTTACARGHPSACRGFSLGPLGVQFIFRTVRRPSRPPGAQPARPSVWPDGWRTQTGKSFRGPALADADGREHRLPCIFTTPPLRTLSRTFERHTNI